MDQGGGQQLIKWLKANRPTFKILAVSGTDLDNFLSALEVVEGDEEQGEDRKPGHGSRVYASRG